MYLDNFINLLNFHPDKTITIKLPDGKIVPPHFHITEVARVRKDFIDCGGTDRHLETCTLQVWVADDTDHRLDAGKLSSILDLSKKLFPSIEIDIEVEYEDVHISQYPLDTVKVENNALVMCLSSKHTDCLAKDKCGIDDTEENESCCSPSSGCC